MLKQCTALWREARFQANMLKAPHARATLDVKASYLKWVERVGFAKVAKTMAGMGHVFCINPADTLRGQGADFLKWVAFWSCRFSGLPRRFSVMGADCV